MRGPSKREANGRHNGGPEGDGVGELARAADQLFYAMRRSRAAAAGGVGVGLSMAQYVLLEPLALISHGDGLSVGHLAASAEVSDPTATRMLKQLESAGVVTRRRSRHDERRVLINLTEDGASRLAAMRAQLRERQSEALATFTPQERYEIAEQLRRLGRVIEGNRGDG